MSSNKQRNQPPRDAEAAVRGEELFRIDGVSKSFRHVDALDDVSLTVGTGEVVGLVGENGAGKSTLLKILTGIHRPDDGQLFLDGEPITVDGPNDAASEGISLVHQEQDVIGNLTGYENMYLGLFDRFTTGGVLDRRAMREAGQEVIDELGIDIDLTDTVAHYDFNERQMLEIAKAFSYLGDADRPIILLDEPTAGLEEEGRDLLFEQIHRLRETASFVFVSHELDEVLEVCDRIYVLKDGAVVDEVAAADTTEDELQRAMVGRDASEEYYHVSAQRTVAGEDVALSADGLATDDGLADVSFDLREGEILGVVGVDGSGKARLGRILGGARAPDAGTVSVGGERIENPTVSKMVDSGVGYVPKERKSEGLLLYQPLRFNVSLPSIGLPSMRDDVPLAGRSLPLIDFDREEELAERAVERLNIKTPGIDELVERLSGGNQQKVVLAKWLMRDVSVLVFDNVTRGIDVGAKEEVYRLCRELADDGVSMLFIGDELPEVIGMANRILVMKDGSIVDVVEAPPGDKPTEEEIIQEMI
ncbi:sugar ABC transporter ATP-binding protein [Halopelagius longus]|uniref:Ribose transport system ATP-binding protein n=1 Tax=Halopelagius longus TaxID=1236180 RepID=A0A1H1FE67_9EURY|nr:sugar ABC transporter ATP-binding protein [Halopelagius longus]RDI70137.1 sugar ABC transporter ATP-binding protein [Halopelagius longus]SDQ99423.1 ribose transport system ATP-binding protein [Halopelagius longus]